MAVLFLAGLITYYWAETRGNPAFAAFHVDQTPFFFSSRRRHTSWPRDWSSDVCSSDLVTGDAVIAFLLFEARFPRSLRYCLASAVTQFRRLMPAQAGGIAEAHQRLQSLDRWLDQQEHGGGIVSDHALLTHVVDETAA